MRSICELKAARLSLSVEIDRSAAISGVAAMPAPSQGRAEPPDDRKQLVLEKLEDLTALLGENLERLLARGEAGHHVVDLIREVRQLVGPQAEEAATLAVPAAAASPRRNAPALL